jgi:hypothetical protein
MRMENELGCVMLKYLLVAVMLLAGASARAGTLESACQAVAAAMFGDAETAGVPSIRTD